MRMLMAICASLALLTATALAQTATASATPLKIQAALLGESSTVVKGLVKEGKLKVAAAYYDIATGNVMLLN